MKKRPSKGQRVYYLSFNYTGIVSPSNITIQDPIYENVEGGYRFNLFSTRKEAQEAKRKIVEILKG